MRRVSAKSQGNRRLKTICLLAVMAAGVATSSLHAADSTTAPTAPSDNPPQTVAAPNYEGGAEFLFDRLQSAIDNLKLDDNSRQKAQQILDESEKSIKLMDQDLQNAAPDQRRQAIRQTFDELRSKLQGVLTPEQQQTLESKFKFSPGPGQATGTANGTGRLAKLKEALSKIDLSDDQKKQIESLTSDLRSQLEALRNGATGDKQQMATKAREIIADFQQKLRATLTPQQRLELRRLFANNAGPTTGPAQTPAN